MWTITLTLDPPEAARTPLAAEWRSWEAGENPFVDMRPTGQSSPSFISLPICCFRRRDEMRGEMLGEEGKTCLDRLDWSALACESVNDVASVSVLSAYQYTYLQCKL
jgi:hypothetical protein